jgi:hypothetical protein
MFDSVCVQERKGEKRATLNQLLDDLQRACRKAGSSSSSDGVRPTREEQEWLVQEMLLQGLMTLEFGFTAYNTNTYLMAAPSASMLGRHRCVFKQRWCSTCPAVWLCG